MDRLLYYLLIKPLSYLPYWALYGLSDFLYLVLYKVFKYRQKVVRKNLVNSFPDKNIEEIESIEKKFYSHFCDLIVESIKMFSLSTEELKKRAKLLNPELLDDLYAKGKSLILAGGHYNNWEMGGTIFCNFVKYHLIGIYAPMSNKFFNNKFLVSRAKFGMEMLSKKNVKEGFLAHKGQLTATVFATDQSPTHSKTVHWTRFLNQNTPVLVGTELFAKQYDYPVVFITTHKVKRGYYEMVAELLVENPTELADGEITEIHTKKLEKDILEAPEFWLWTHKRWKREMKEGDQLYKAS